MKEYLRKQTKVFGDIIGEVKCNDCNTNASQYSTWPALIFSLKTFTVNEDKNLVLSNELIKVELPP